ncbi:MAG TPA: N-acetylmuramoyl-L-alanine amidase [Anaeromyxobacteraceae bacterium]|nr:N-acetylmuramoyl-L-alanine amidase [Anaeromyxobacteraceae bacterium]
MLAPACAVLMVVLSAPGAPRPAHARRPVAQLPAPRSRRLSALDRARGLLAQVKRDPNKRRYRHRWERAIAALEHAARGKERGVALLDAARARYALYRFSQVEADRSEALRLAVKAQRAGATEALAFSSAVRREMGQDEEPARSGRPIRNRSEVAETPPQAGGAPSTPEPSSDPALEQALSGEGASASRTSEENAGPAAVSEVRSWSNADYTRVAIYLSRAVRYTQEEIPAEGDHPRRLALDLKPAELGRGLAHPVNDTLVSRVRAAQRDPETVRVVLDLPGRDDFAIFSLEDPPRLIVDVGSTKPRPEAPPAERPPAGELARGRPIHRIILDAGHGGHDSGAIGPSGVREKEVTLLMAKRLAAELEGKGFEVVLTRRDDRFVPLEERAAVANTRKGDLFVSLHANANPRREERGIETYVLNVADDRYAARLAARENGAFSDEDEAPLEVRHILADLDAQSSADASRRLAELVQRQLCAGVRAHVGEVRDLGVKSALFYVLLGARMPAVLVETSFISNRTEEKRLKSPKFQQEVAASIARAIEVFANREARLALLR